MNRRNFISGLGLSVVPAIIRTPGLLMPIKALKLTPAFVYKSDYEHIFYENGEYLVLRGIMRYNK